MRSDDCWRLHLQPFPAYLSFLDVFYFVASGGVGEVREGGGGGRKGKEEGREDKKEEERK